MEATFSVKYAGFWTRFWAYLFDLLIIASIGWLLIRPVFRLFNLELQTSIWYAPITIISIIVFYGYFLLMTYFFGQTLGKMILGIRVVSLHPEKLSLSTLVFREIVGRIISVVPFNLPYIVVGFTPKKQAIHDFIADTVVIHEEDYQKRRIANQLHQPNTVQ